MKLLQNKHLLILTVIIICGFILRSWNMSYLYGYGHDQDLSGWFVRQVAVEHKMRLIGQETSTPGIFIGPVFYYYLTLIYAIFQLNPLAGPIAGIILGIFWILSVFFVTSKFAGIRVGLIASLLYAISFYTVANDREIVPTQPVIAWSFWYFYSLYLISLNRKAGYFIAGLLIGLIWHLNMALILLTPLIPICILISKNRMKINCIGLFIAGFIPPSIPLLLFEIRHGFTQTKSFVLSLTTNQHDIISGTEKFERVILLASKDLTNFIIGPTFLTYSFWTSLFLLTITVLFYKKVLARKYLILITAWILLVVGFFTLYSKVISEYYLNSLIAVFIIVFSVFIERLLRLSKMVTLILLFLFISINSIRLVSQVPSGNGYIDRMNIVSKIKSDAISRGYKCIAVSYITNPGYDLGYRYLFFYQNISVLQPKSLAPVYTIVFPLSLVDRVDTRSGGIGLIYPDYYRYGSTEDICKGKNDNITIPMWGFPV